MGIEYRFISITHCNMCNADSSYFKILGKRQNQSQGRKPNRNFSITTTIVKCKNCGLIFSNPLPVPVNIMDHYGVPPEEYWVEKYFEIDPDYNIKIKNWISKHINISNGAKSLDIGAGIGKMMLALTYSGFDAYGLEPSKPFYDKAISKMNINPEKLKLSTLEDADYPDNYFDLIIFSAVLEHLYDPSQALSKALKWLKNDGLIQIEVPSSNWLINKFGNLYYKSIGTGYVANISPMHKPYHLYEFSVKSFQLNGILNNYTIDNFKYWLGETTYMPKMFDNILKYYMKKTNSGMEISIFLRKKPL